MPEDSSVGERIVEAVLTALNDGTDAPCKFFRTRQDAFHSKELPAGVVFALAEDTKRRGEDSIDPLRTTYRQLPDAAVRERKIRLELHIAGEPPIDAAADPIYVYAVKTLHANLGLQGLIRGLAESSVQWETDASYDDRCLAAIDLRFVFATKATDPTIQLT